MNSVEIKSISNSVELSTFDVCTTTYFLAAASMLQEHLLAKMPPPKEVNPDEL